MSRRQAAKGSVGRVGVLALGLWGLTACGGKAQAADVEQTGASGQGGSAGSGGVGARAGTGVGAGTGGTGGAGGVAEEPASALEDSVPWFTGAGDSDYPTTTEDQVLHIAVSEAPARATLSTHNHYAALSFAEGVQFSARASEPTRLLVSASRRIQDFDYFTAREAGTQWPLAEVEVGVEWRDFSVSFDSMTPPEMTAAPEPAFSLAFIVDHPRAIDVWLDEVRFKPRLQP